MKRVIIESPYAGDIERNTTYARRAMKFSLDNYYAPFLSHLLYTQVYDDNDPFQRDRGIRAGYAWLKHAEEVHFYLDYGMSPGMQRTEELCKIIGIPTTDYHIGKNP